MFLYFTPTYSNDYYLKGKTPTDFMKSGYKLFAVTYADRDNYDIAYTFIKNTKIVTCRIRLDSAFGEPDAKHRCYAISD